MTCPCRLFLLLYRPCEGHVRPPPAVQLPKRCVCRGSLGLTRYTSVSTTTWSLCGWATRNWQSKGMLMSAKNCSRDMLVSRNSSQMALDETVSTNACENLFSGLIYRNVFVITISLYFRSVCFVDYFIINIFIYITVRNYVNISISVN